MEMQLIDKEKKIFRAKNIEMQFVKPYYLMHIDELKLIKGVVRGSTLCWNVAGGVITYNMVRNL